MKVNNRLSSDWELQAWEFKKQHAVKLAKGGVPIQAILRRTGLPVRTARRAIEEAGLKVPHER